MLDIDLIQLRHNYAPDFDTEPSGDIYMPHGLWVAGARLMEAGVDCSFQDENLGPSKVSSSLVGTSLVGPPYIPEAQKFMNRFSDEIRFILGGQVISGLSESQFNQLFGNKSVNGMSDSALASALDINEEDLPPAEKTSLIPVYEEISDVDLKKYLSREFSFYLSQGCKHNCEYCAAANQRAEIYRDFSVIKNDLDYLVARAEKLRIRELSIYLSNLDIFQTPDSLFMFGEILEDIKANYPEVQLKFHGLSRINSFLDASKKHPEKIEALVNAGLSRIGFGVDNARDLEECKNAIRSAHEFGIRPGISIIIGDRNLGTESELKSAVAFSEQMTSKYNALLMPFLSKGVLPGNKGWEDPENSPTVDDLLRNPESFQALDFTALPSRFSHPDPAIRELVTLYYLRLCGVLGNAIEYVHPIAPGLSPEIVEKIKQFNLRKY